MWGNRLWRILLPIPLVFPTFIGAAAFIRTMNPGGLMNRMLDGFGIETVIEMRGFSALGWFSPYFVIHMCTFQLLRVYGNFHNR